MATEEAARQAAAAEAAAWAERVAAAEAAAEGARTNCLGLESELAALRKQKAWTPKAAEVCQILGYIISLVAPATHVPLTIEDALPLQQLQLCALIAPNADED